MMTDFFSETIKIRKYWNDIFKMLKIKPANIEFYIQGRYYYYLSHMAYMRIKCATIINHLEEYLVHNSKEVLVT